MTKITKELLAKHLYCDWKVVNYGDQNISLECNSCYEVISDFEVDSVRKLVEEAENVHTLNATVRSD